MKIDNQWCSVSYDINIFQSLFELKLWSQKYYKILISFSCKKKMFDVDSKDLKGSLEFNWFLVESANSIENEK